MRHQIGLAPSLSKFVYTVEEQMMRIAWQHRDAGAKGVSISKEQPTRHQGPVGGQQCHASDCWKHACAVAQQQVWRASALRHLGCFWLCFVKEECTIERASCLKNRCSKGVLVMWKCAQQTQPRSSNFQKGNFNHVQQIREGYVLA